MVSSLATDYAVNYNDTGISVANENKQQTEYWTWLDQACADEIRRAGMLPIGSSLVPLEMTQPPSAVTHESSKRLHNNHLIHTVRQTPQKASPEDLMKMPPPGEHERLTKLGLSYDNLKILEETKGFFNRLRFLIHCLANQELPAIQWSSEFDCIIFRKKDASVITQLCAGITKSKQYESRTLAQFLKVIGFVKTNLLCQKRQDKRLKNIDQQTHTAMIRVQSDIPYPAVTRKRRSLPGLTSDVAPVKRACSEHFVTRLYGLINKLANDPLPAIRWNTEGNAIIVNINFIHLKFNTIELTNMKHFKSFQRQLYYYGFKFQKSSLDNDEKIYCHPYFQRDRPDLLSNIHKSIGMICS